MTIDDVPSIASGQSPRSRVSEKMRLNKLGSQIVLVLLLSIHPTANLRVMAQSLESSLQAAELGHADAQFDLGMRYIQGRGLKKDYAEAANWFLEAADQGHAGAALQLGILSERGNGVERDPERALDLYHLAAEMGHADAMYTLSTRYRQGQGVPRDIEQAGFWYDRAIAVWNEENSEQADKMFLRHR